MTQSKRMSILRRLSIGRKLTMGFGILVVLTLIGVVVNYATGSQAARSIARTNDVRVPTALAASRAQADLLRMLGDIRGYLVLSDEALLQSYELSKQDFERDLSTLEALSPNLGPENQARLIRVRAAFQNWIALPPKLSEYVDDQFEREPAYRLLVTDGIKRAGAVLININDMIELQGKRQPTVDNMALLTDMAKFQGTFSGMLSGLRGYVTTRNRSFYQEYEVNRTANQFAWERLTDKRSQLSPSQLEAFDRIAENRDAFLGLPEQIFPLLEGEHWREDLFVFRTEAVPLTDQMSEDLRGLTGDQQDLLQRELSDGTYRLYLARWLVFVGGLVAVLFGIGLALVLRSHIAGPIVRLTSVAERIRGGDLEAQAAVESQDETGLLAETFNDMTGQLRGSLKQVQSEKKRADDLLEVVIPIGVALSTEREDFNRLLENIILRAQKFCKADSGTLYLQDENQELRYVILHNNRFGVDLGGTTNREIPFAPMPLYDPVTKQPNLRLIPARVALNGTIVNVSDMAEANEYDCFSYADLGIEGADSILALPLINTAGRTLGVLVLGNYRDPTTGKPDVFDANLQRMMESYSSLAVAALEGYLREQSLRREILQLRIEIDEAKQQKQVAEIIETDFFQDLSVKIQTMRRRKREGASDPIEPPVKGSGEAADVAVKTEEDIDGQI